MNLGENRHASFYWYSWGSSSQPQGVSSTRYAVIWQTSSSFPNFVLHGVLVDLTKYFKAALVVDPVMVSTSGDILAGPSILDGFWYVKIFLMNLLLMILIFLRTSSYFLYLYVNTLLLITSITRSKNSNGWFLYKLMLRISANSISYFVQRFNHLNKVLTWWKVHIGWLTVGSYITYKEQCLKPKVENMGLSLELDGIHLLSFICFIHFFFG